MNRPAIEIRVVNQLQLHLHEIVQVKTAAGWVTVPHLTECKQKAVLLEGSYPECFLNYVALVTA